MTLPNVVVLGVAKAGTTSLYHYLRPHPQVAVASVREPKFLFYAGYLRNPVERSLRNVSVRTQAQYEALFSGKDQFPVRVDISPVYFAYPDQTILGIKEYVPDAKLIVIYRQPVDRAYSAYVMHVREGQEPIRDFAKAVDAEETVLPRSGARRRNYLGGSWYAARTRKYLEAFPRDQMHFLLYDDFVSDPAGFMRSIYAILGVEPDTLPEKMIRHNAGVWPKHTAVHRLLAWRFALPPRVRALVPADIRRRAFSAVRAASYGPPPPLDPGFKKELTGRFRDDILELQGLIGRDLSQWLREES
jgi:hypothetical protein